MFEKRVLRRIFGPKRDEITGESRTLHNEYLNDLYSSPNIFQVIKKTNMRWAGHVVRVGKSRGVCRILVGNMRERDHLEDLRVDGKKILSWIYRKWDGGAWTGLIWLRIRTWRPLVNVVMHLRVP
jgi:hypothetical protein